MADSGTAHRPQSSAEPVEERGSVWSAAGRVVAPLVDLILPPVCALCGEPHSPARPAGPAAVAGSVAGCGCLRLCAACIGRLLENRRDACRRCGQPVGPYASDTSRGCVICRPKRQRYTEVVPLGTYDGSIREACIRCKNRGAEPLAAALGELLWQENQVRLRALTADLIVPVPQHWVHWFIRPHHSALTLAATLSTRLKIPLCDRLVLKVRHTADQSSLHRAERLKNLEGAFRVRTPGRVVGRRVLVVDDILTTGSTAGEMARALRAAGARSVAVAVVAVVR